MESELTPGVRAHHRLVVGTAAAVANAAWHATGVRVRDLPVTLDRVLGR